MCYRFWWSSLFHLCICKYSLQHQLCRFMTLNIVSVFFCSSSHLLSFLPVSEERGMIGWFSCLTAEVCGSWAAAMSVHACTVAAISCFICSSWQWVSHMRKLHLRSGRLLMTWEWRYLYNFHLSCSISYSQGEAEGSHSSFRLSLGHSVAEVPSSVFFREDIGHRAFLLPESFLGLFKSVSLDSFNSLEKKLVLMASFRTFCPEDTLIMTDNFCGWSSLYVVQILWFSYTLHVSWRNKVTFEDAVFERLLFVFILFCGDDCGREKHR